MINKSEEKTMEWETKVWAWITKEMPHKHSDRFAPLFKIIHEVYEKAYQDASKRFRIRESELLKMEQDSFRRKVEEMKIDDLPNGVDINGHDIDAEDYNTIIDEVLAKLKNIR